MSQLPRTAVILCRVLEAEIEHFARGAPHIVHLEKLPQGLHQDPLRLNQELQAAIERVESLTDAEQIALGFGLCSRATEGIRTRRCTLVVPRAHDCVTLLLGSKERYGQYVADNPGTYWYSPGWNRNHEPPGRERFERQQADYVEKYGADNAAYLMETEQGWFSTYRRATFVDLGVSDTREDEAFTRDCANWLGWEYDRQYGDPSLLRELVTGPWHDSRFLTVQPGRSFHMSGDDSVIAIDFNV